MYIIYNNEKDKKAIKTNSNKDEWNKTNDLNPLPLISKKQIKHKFKNIKLLQ